MLLSVVVPCMNEEESIPSLVQRLVETIEPYKDNTEIILVDDGSTDNTWEKISELAEEVEQLRGIKLSTNRGHQIALTAGLEAARGQRIFMLDADLQDPPELLHDMMPMMDRGYDVVYGKRSERLGESAFKKVTAHMFYRFINTLSDVAIPTDTGDFRLVSRRALDAILAMPERARFLRGMFAWVGFDQVAIEYRRAPRSVGETKYPLSKMLQLATDAITSFSIRPLRWATRLAYLSLVVAAVLMIFVLYSLVALKTVQGWASVVFAVSAFSGVQLLTLGILGEYVGRLYFESKERPLYFISENTGTDTDNDNSADTDS